MVRALAHHFRSPFRNCTGWFRAVLHLYICIHHSFGRKAHLWRHKCTHTSAPLPSFTDWMTGAASGEKGWSRMSTCSSV